MASLPYPLNRLYTHIVSVIAITQSACILMSVWVWQGCHTLLQIPILLFLKNLFFCLFKNNMFSCSSVFSNNNMFSCPHVFKTKTCSHVLLSFQKQPVLMFFCLFNNNMFSCSLVFQKQHVLLSFPQKSHILHPILSLCRQKKRLRATLPAVKP